ncbi:glycosyltransferase family 4 protein [Desulfobacterota bacterium M19]
MTGGRGKKVFTGSIKAADKQEHFMAADIFVRPHMGTGKLADAEKKLCFVLDSYWGQCMGGAELQACYLEQEALRQGWSTHYCFLSNGSDFENCSATTLHPILQKKFWSKLGSIKYPYVKKMLQILHGIKPDIIYQRCGLSFTGIAAYYAKKNNCKLIFHIAHDRDVHITSCPKLHPWLVPEKKMMQYGIRNAAMIIAQTHYQAEQLTKNYGRSAVVISNGHPVPDDCRKVSLSPIKVLWIANWKPVKQPEVFFHLVEALGTEDNVHFVMLGRTAGYEQLIKKAKAFGIEVRGEVSMDKVNELLADSHILVNTSRQEGFSNTFIQAWMRRVPVVSLQVDPDNILRQEKIGFCSGSFEKLVEDTNRLINGHHLRDSMGHRAREYAVKHHSLNNIRQVIEVCNRLREETSRVD